MAYCMFSSARTSARLSSVPVHPCSSLDFFDLFKQPADIFLSLLKKTATSMDSSSFVFIHRDRSSVQTDYPCKFEGQDKL